MKRILLYGYGGYGKVLSELLLEDGFDWIGVFDDQNIEISQPNTQYIGKYNSELYEDIPLIIAIGNNKARANVAKIIKHKYLTFIHQSAFVSNSAFISEGTVILQNAVIQANTNIGAHCLVNANAVIDHDTKVANFVYVGSLTYIGSNSQISPLTEISPGQIFPRFSKF